MAISVKKFPNLRARRYEDVRDELQSGDVLLCKGSGIFSKMIQESSGSIWSHVGFIMRLDSIDRVMVLESVESIGVRTVPFSHYIKNYKDGKGYPGRLLVARLRDFPSDNAKKLNRLSQFAVDRFGCPYNTDGIAKIAARITLGLFGFHGKRLKDDQEFICSEYAYYCYKSVGLEIPWDDRGFIAPKDFAQARGMRAIAALKVRR